MYLQAGGGIVFDSVEEDEYYETINKLKANVTCINEAESESLCGFDESELTWQNTTSNCRVKLLEALDHHACILCISAAHECSVQDT